MKILNRLFPEMKTETKTTKVQFEKQEPVTAYSFQDEKIKEIFNKQNVPLTDEIMEDVKVFLSETEGDLETKLATVDLALEKGVEVTSDNLKRIHTAIHEPLNTDMKDLELVDLKKVLSELPKEMRNVIKTTVTGQRPLEEVIKGLVSEKLAQLFLNGVAIEEVKGETKVTNDDTPKTQTNDLPNNIQSKPQPTMKIINHADLEPMEVPEELLDDISEDDLKIVTEAFENLSEQLDELSELLVPVMDTSLLNEHIPVKKVLETKVTVKMIEAKQTFELYQKSIQSQLSQAIEHPQDKTSLKDILGAVIDKLDHILMKTDVTMYTDIKTERDLLASSGQLEKARQLIGHKDVEALKIVKEVKARVDQIQFKPSSQKMFGVTQRAFVEKLYDEQMIKALPIQIEQNMAVSSRAVLETIRGLGINHEAEASEILRRDEKSAFKLPINMKSVLLKLEESAQQKVLTKDTLDNLTGQQLMNKLEIKSHKQKLMFNVPVKIDGSVKQLKVHVNAKKDQQKIDWKNSRLYFVIHLDKLGDTGVLVDVNNGSVNVTIKNDSPNIEESMTPYVEDALNRLESVGFTTSLIKFESLSDEKSKDEPIVAFDKERFDVSI